MAKQVDHLTDGSESFEKFKVDVFDTLKAILENQNQIRQEMFLIRTNESNTSPKPNVKKSEEATGSPKPPAATRGEPASSSRPPPPPPTRASSRRQGSSKSTSSPTVQPSTPQERQFVPSSGNTKKSQSWFLVY